MARVIIKDDGPGMSMELGQLILKLSEATSSSAYFTVGVSGGSLIKLLSRALSENLRIDFSNWRVFFCDERLVPVDDAESTFGAYINEFKGKVPINTDQFIAIQQGVAADIAAVEYTKQIEVYFPPPKLPEFDLLLLGMGPDGHTCSLFPGHALLQEKQKWVAPITDSPKPPPSRITFTLPLINNAKVCMFIVTGEGKANTVKRILKDKEQLPAALVQPKQGQLYWILDNAAASLL